MTSRPLEPSPDQAAAELSDDAVEPSAAAPRPWWHWALRIVAGLVVATVVVAVLWDKVPSPHEVAVSFRRARWWWVGAAAAFQAASIGMLIRQQRRLLRAFGVQVSLFQVGVITYSSTAMTMSLPAGSALGAGFSYRQYRAHGASAATAATVLLISGVLSLSALVLLYVGGVGLAAGSHFLHLGQAYPLLAALIGLGICAALVGLVWLSNRPARMAAAQRPARELGPRVRRFAAWLDRHPKLKAGFRQMLDTGRQAGRVRGHDWRLALWTSALNWGLDLCCLYASCRAFAIVIDPFQLALIYLGIQVVRQIPLTPGGIGVIEATLLASLVAAHAAQGPASAAVLVYRLFSAWLIVPIGYLSMTLLRRRKPRVAG